MKERRFKVEKIKETFLDLLVNLKRQIVALNIKLYNSFFENLDLETRNLLEQITKKEEERFELQERLILKAATETNSEILELINEIEVFLAIKRRLVFQVLKAKNEDNVEVLKDAIKEELKVLSSEKSFYENFTDLKNYKIN